jgi:TetR/AcrR family transcriptional regulator, tetracycline repressor protein
VAQMSQRGRPGPKGTLSDQTILDAAQNLISSGGAGAVTVRGIAAQVGVAPNAVYTYFPDKAAVLRALVERLLGEVNLEGLTDRARPWRHRLQSLAVEFRTHLLSHPGAVNLLLSGPMDGPNALALGERLLEVFADAGLTPDDAARASYLFTTYILGSIALEAAELEHSAPPPPEDERVVTRHVSFAAVPPDRYPRTAATATTMARYITTEQFIWGLTRVLDGLTAHGSTSFPDGCATDEPAASRPPRP